MAGPAGAPSGRRGRERRGPGRTGWRGTRRWRRPHRRRGPLRARASPPCGAKGLAGSVAPAWGANPPAAPAAAAPAPAGPTCVAWVAQGSAAGPEPGAGAHSSGAWPARLTHRGAGSASDAVGPKPLPGGWPPQGSAVAAPTSTAAAPPPFQGSGAAGPPGAGPRTSVAAVAHSSGAGAGAAGPPPLGATAERMSSGVVATGGRLTVASVCWAAEPQALSWLPNGLEGGGAGRCRRGHGGLGRGRRLRRGRPGDLQRPGDRRHRAGCGLRTGARGTVGGRPGGCSGGRRGLEAEVVERRPVAPGREARRPLRGRRVDPPVGIVVLGHARSPSFRPGPSATAAARPPQRATVGGPEADNANNLGPARTDRRGHGVCDVRHMPSPSDPRPAPPGRLPGGC